jgi:hypothetical protein
MAEERTLNFDEALELLVDADWRWGKFMERPNGMESLRDQLARAWS